ncbi:H/ACA ribonucleoprotein complex subunit [Aphelenchoides bicaudatus]|nr:H/ACA ribonucleoprotein complex subunit [Aphelenchoides bicaudatus]
MARAQQSGLVEVGHFLHPCENDLVCSTTCGKIPFFNAPIYFENEEQVGKVDEIFGSPQEHGFSVKLSEGIKASAFTPNQTLFIEGAKLLPVDRFLPGAKPFNRPSRGGGGVRGRGRGSFRGVDRLIVVVEALEIAVEALVVEDLAVEALEIAVEALVVEDLAVIVEVFVVEDLVTVDEVLATIAIILESVITIQVLPLQRNSDLIR